jgi:staphylococcal nuclease domain-containing protein 1
MASRKSGSGTIKAVLSGDTVVIVGKAAGGPPPELQVSLSSVIAPKLGRNENPDEPFAWSSREFLRELCIGKAVTFEVEYSVPAISRDFGAVLLDGENLCKVVAREGWVTVKSLQQSPEGQRSRDYEEMIVLQDGAMAEGRGIHTQDPSLISIAIRDVKQPDDYQPKNLFDKYGGQPQPAVIEYVFDGSTCKVLLLTRPFYLVTLNLAGVQTPKLKGVTGPEPYSREAKHFCDLRLLHRKLDVRIDGLDKYDNFVGSILHPAGNISEELLKAGLARIADWSCSFLKRDAVLAMKVLERGAKQARIRLWKDYNPGREGGGATHTVVGKVVEIFSGDTIYVATGEGGSGEERRVCLSSVRAPRMGHSRKGIDDAPWAFEVISRV